MILKYIPMSYSTENSKDLLFLI